MADKYSTTIDELIAHSRELRRQWDDEERPFVAGDLARVLMWIGSIPEPPRHQTLVAGQLIRAITDAIENAIVTIRERGV